MKLFIDPNQMEKQYNAILAWLKALMNAFADGLNDYLYRHPEVKPRGIQRFEPWMALTFSEGSIGDDIESINLEQLQAFYGKTKISRSLNTDESEPPEPTGSNGIADADGHIAYFHANFIPRRDPHFDWNRPLDGSNPATEWRGLLSIDETPHLLNPKSGWLYNSNNWPWSAAGPSSPKKEDYPAYVEKGRESARGLHAVRVLENKKDLTISSLIAAAYDSYLPWFEKPLPALFKAWAALSTGNPQRAKLAEPIALLRSWHYRWGVKSAPTAVAVFWAKEVRRRVSGDAVANAKPELLLEALSAAIDRLTNDFGTWKIEWGAINRFQRLNDGIVPKFSDAKPSIPVGFTSSQWGSLASFGAHPYSGTKKWYGNTGNSFVAVVEFGDTVQAYAITAGGESGHPSSPHFDDQAERYSTGNLRQVYFYRFYRAQLRGHTEREYHPGS
jgi:acyl-homoserine-lactone acylase